MPTEPLTRDELANRYFEQLPYPPYPVQEEALLAWFTSDQGILVCAPTGMGKTLIAEAALFEALHTGKTAYYTTPLIALTEQKFAEMQSAALRWGFSLDDVGLVTGNRRVNPNARILVVVAEILLNRLLHSAAFDFTQVSSVVMDEFHSFNDPERGAVWEFSLGLLPPHVRLMLLSATVGNSPEFISWLSRAHQRKLDLVQSTQRKVPLAYQWVGDMLLNEHLEAMAEGTEEGRRTPALVFCFNREECWSVAEQLKGKQMLATGQQARLVAELAAHDWSQGAGPKLKQILLRGVGVHHAGLLPKYRRIVEYLFQHKLLSVCVCTETLSAGINLPARSVVLPNLLKGPRGKQKIIEPSAAHQMFGRAGRPQFDAQGYVFALAHEDDVKILRWREKYDSIPEDTKDPGLMKAKKALKKKMPTRRTNQQYWTQGQFEKLCLAPPANLASRGHLPWRMLAHLLETSPEIEPLRKLVAKRLLDNKQLEVAQRELDKMLLLLWKGGFVRLEPEPPPPPTDASPAPSESAAQTGGGVASSTDGRTPLIPTAPQAPAAKQPVVLKSWLGTIGIDVNAKQPEPPPYKPLRAHPTEQLARLAVLRGVNPLYGVFLADQLGIADLAEKLQAFESLLELPKSVGYFVHVPSNQDLPPGPLATTRLDSQLLTLGLATAQQLGAETPKLEGAEYVEDDDDPWDDGERKWVLKLADKLRLLFDAQFPGVHDLNTNAVWAAGELLEYGCDFNKYVTSKGLQKQEGIVFRHALRLILLLGEFQQLTPPEVSPDIWRGELQDVADRLTEGCRQVDPTSTDKALEEAKAEAKAEVVL